MTAPRVLSTTAGELPLEEIRLQVEGREWTVLHTGALVTREEEEAFLTSEQASLPYGIVLWPAAIALAHELAVRPLRGLRVLELGAGTGLPGIVAASLGARVVQTDKHPVALHLARENAQRNGVTAAIAHRAVDWAAWPAEDGERHDLIIASDVLYSDSMHPHLRRIFEEHLAPGGAVLIGDPFRRYAIQFLEGLEASGWRVTMNKWTIGVQPPARPVGVFTLTRR